jgi:hypothetical protein
MTPWSLKKGKKEKTHEPIGKSEGAQLILA